MFLHALGSSRLVVSVGVTLSLTLGPARAWGQHAITPETTVKLAVVDEVSSARSAKGDRINFRVDDDVLDKHGCVVIRKGTLAYGTVEKARRAGAWGRRGVLELSVDYTTAIDGQRIELRGHKEESGTAKRGLVTAGAWLIAWPLAFIRGKNVSIPSGHSIVVWADATVSVRTGSGEGGSTDVVRADGTARIVLKNGDVYSGTVVELEGGQYTIKTAGGTIRVPAASVTSINSGGPSAPAGTSGDPKLGIAEDADHRQKYEKVLERIRRKQPR